MHIRQLLPAATLLINTVAGYGNENPVRSLRNMNPLEMVKQRVIQKAFTYGTLQQVTDEGNSTTNDVYFLGKVGIGTTAPVVSLEIKYNSVYTDYASAGQVPSGLRIYNTNTTTGSLNNLSFSLANAGSAGAIISLANTNTSGASSTATGDLLFATKPAGLSTVLERVRILSDGKTGIGLADPNYQLDVNKIIAISNPSSSANQNAALLLRTYSTNWGYRESAIRSTLLNATTGLNRLDFNVADAQTTGADLTALSIVSTGNVGVNTTAPVGKMNINVANSSDVNDGLFITRASTYNKFGFVLKSNGSGVYRSALTVKRLPEEAEVEAMSFDMSNGYLGIGVTAPSVRLKVGGDIEANGMLRGTGWLTGTGTGLGAEVGISNGISYFFGFDRTSYQYIPTRLVGSTIDIRHSDASSDLFVNAYGDVGIGTNDPKGYKLAVNGPAIFSRAVVKNYTAWPDYVFHPTYQLRSLVDLEKYIQANQHLPEVPSAEEIADKGIEVGEVQVQLLKKIEELTLYVIEQDKKIAAMQVEIKALKKK